MIIACSPLRISIGGGGTDLPSYYRRFTGELIAVAIDKYIYVTVTEPFFPGIYLKYSALEKVQRLDDVQHNIMREALRDFLPNGETPAIEITTLADVPAGTGLGSSSSFTCALLQALSAHWHKFLDRQQLAERACAIEIDRLGAPIGKQDQYAATFGGLRRYVFNPDDSVTIKELRMARDKVAELEDSLLLFFTGKTRAAGDILAEQKARTEGADEAMLANLHQVKTIGQEIGTALEAGDFAAYGELMHRHWMRKQERSKSMGNPRISEIYDYARGNGASGGKLVGAGGGGFLLFYAPEPNRLRRAMEGKGLRELRFKFDQAGTRILEA
jgi:D-glycero-alpha-D-manno-heptose-7-phosphate kinase